MKQTVLKIITKLTNEKKAQNIFPTHIASHLVVTAMMAETRAALNELHKEGKIKAVDTIHGTSIELQENA